MPTPNEQKNIDYLRLAGKTLAELASSHAWAAGCDHCTCGYVSAPDISETSPNSTYLQRAIQAAQGEIVFCTCQAGVQMRSYLRRVWVAELKGRPVIDEEYPVPTVHYEQAQSLPVAVGGAAYREFA